MRNGRRVVAHGSHSFNFHAPLQFIYTEPRAYIAQRMCNARLNMRDRMNEIDLEARGFAT
ncbi:hypothetical protein [Xanthomonas arboricola]|uniref:hypothetical protein n=1 Tax=Xanthomonas arboricola TaxID=56448 RepID=UPI0016AA76AE|nr:hypothetical protein [Xanthomonas arboricola]NJB94913.1 hypothetical protein [Xanthomonas arboricola]